MVLHTYNLTSPGWSHTCSFKDSIDPVWGPRSHPTVSLLYVFCLHFWWFIILEPCWCWCRRAVRQTSLLWQHSTMTLHQSNYYHLHRETGFSAKLELLSWDSLVLVKVLRNPALNTHLTHSFYPLLKKLIPGRCVSTVTESLFASLLKQFPATRKNTSKVKNVKDFLLEILLSVFISYSEA